jgi:hypothetical protein
MPRETKGPRTARNPPPTYRETDYIAVPDNDGMGLHGQMQWKF